MSTNDLAAALHVPPSSATSMIKALTCQGMTTHTPYHGVRLTPAGERVALEVIRYHRLIEPYLQEFVGLGRDEMHAEAEQPLVLFLALPPAARGTVGRVTAHAPDKLWYLASLGLVSGTEVTLVDVAPFGGPVQVRVGAQEHRFGPELARDVLRAWSE